MPVGLKAGPMSQYLQYLKGALLSLTMNSCLAPVSTHHITHQCLTSSPPPLLPSNNATDKKKKNPVIILPLNNYVQQISEIPSLMEDS